MRNILVLAGIFIASVSSGQSFRFTSDGVKRQSAGVYDHKDRLIRTLFSGKVFPSNTYTYDWDGLDDQGYVAPKGKYTVKLIENDIKYKWEGIIGNTSDSLTGPTKWRGYGLANGLVAVGSYVYVAQGYGEFINSSYRFHISAPNTKLAAFTDNKTVQTALAVCSDSNYIYWAEWGHSTSTKEKSAWIIHATTVSDNSPVKFSSGITYSLLWSRPRSVIGLQDEVIHPDAKAPTAMAVQRQGRFLFVSRKEGNRIDVYNKKTGAFVRSLTFSKPTGLSIDRSDNLWIITSDNLVSKHKVQTDGKLSGSVLNIKGLSQPQTVCVSNDGSYILVADCGDSQQLKAFSNSTGAKLWTLGSEGGYKNSSEVTNFRYMFSDVNGIDFNKYFIPTITFQNDGSFWFTDRLNRRMLHFDANRKYIDNIMFLGSPYYNTLVGGDPSRLIVNNLEFSIDYSKPLEKGWALKRNYGYRVDAENYEHHTRGIAYAAKFTNGRTYGLYRRRGYGPMGNNFEIVELTESGLRMTGILIEGVGMTAMTDDGAIIQQTQRKYGQPVTIKRKSVIGFDANGNPKYSAFASILETPDLTKKSPVHWAQLIPAITENGYFWFFDPSPKQEADGYHLGAVPIGGKEWFVQTSKGTGRNYAGDYPTDGRFDDGNGVNAYAGSQVSASGKNVIWGYHGEFWRNGQVNKYSHYWENGLFLGQFGKTWNELGFGGNVHNIRSPEEFAGNALSPVVVTGPDGNLYLYHGDESHHGGIHRWKISGLETINEQEFPLDEDKISSFKVSFSSDKTAGCLPFEVQFTADSGTSNVTITKWFWDFGDGTTSTERQPRHTYENAGSYKVTMVASNASGCTNTVSRANYIQVLNKPNVAILNDTTGCLGANINFKADLVSENTWRYKWNWEFGNGQTDTTQNPEPHVYENVGIYPVTLTIKDDFGCSAKAESKVKIHPTPVVNAGPDREICLGSSQQLKATGAEKYSWENADGLSCTDCDTPLAKPSDWTQYKVTGTNEFGCSSSDWVTVTVRQPFQLDVEGKKDICIGESVELTASGADQYLWLSAGGGTNPVITSMPQLSTQYTVVAKDDAGCFTDTASVAVNVHQLPVIQAGVDAEICRGSTQQLQASGAIRYSWNETSALSCTDCPSPLAAPTATRQFVVTGFDTYGCSSSDSVLVTVHQPFKVSIDPVTDICIGQPATLTARGADQYSWSPSTSVSNPVSATTTVMPQLSTQYTVVAKDDAGCFTDTASVNVTVWSYPTVEAGDAQTLSVGHALKLSPVYSADVNTYRWSHPQSLSCSNCAFPEAKPKSETTYRIEVANNGGCRASDEVTVRVICNNGNLFIPNTFSPNQDGRNDRFFPRGTGIDRVKSFKIYNRWGEMVYSNENFQANDPSLGWDGRFKGQVLPSDVFVYSCEVVCTNNELLTFKGDVTLLR